MKKVEVFKHEPTGQLFELEADYKKCVLSYKKKQAKLAEEKRIADNWNNLIHEPRLTATSIEDFRVKVMNRWNEINSKYGVTMLSLNFENMTFNHVISNSHNSPIGYKQNWCGYGDKEGIPKGYPGWRGRLSGKLSDWKNGILSYNFYREFRSGVKIPGLNTESGGGGDNFGYELKLYIYDFPLIYKDFKESFDKKDQIEAELRESKQADEAYSQRLTNYVNLVPDIRNLQNEIDADESQIKRLKEANSIRNTSMINFRKEFQEKFKTENPYDFNKTKEIENKLYAITSNINL